MNRKAEDSDVLARVEKGLQEGLQFLSGDISLRTTLVFAAPPALRAKDILRLRRSFKMSQGAFAKVINVSRKTVQSWEQGYRKPSQACLRLLQIMAENHEFMSSFVGAQNGRV